MKTLKTPLWILLVMSLLTSQQVMSQSINSPHIDQRKTIEQELVNPNPNGFNKIVYHPTAKSDLAAYSHARIMRNKTVKLLIEQLLQSLKEGKTFPTKQAMALYKGSKSVALRFPKEAFAFYMAQYLVSFRKMGFFASNADLDPAAFVNFFESLKSPTGYVGFLGFMLANHGAQVAMNKLVRYSYAVYRVKSKHKRRSILRGFHKIKKFIVPQISMAIGMMTSSFIEELAHDQDILECIELSTKSIQKNSKKNRACEKAYHYWTASNKLWSWTPHIFSMLGASLISGVVVRNSMKAAAGVGHSIYMTTKTRNAIALRPTTIVTGRITLAARLSAFSGGPIVGFLANVGFTTINLYSFMEFIGLTDALIKPYIMYSKKAYVTDGILARKFDLLPAYKDVFAQGGWDNIDKHKGTKENCLWAESRSSILYQGFAPWAESCDFEGEDFLSKLKLFSYDIEGYRRYRLQDFSTAVNSWQLYMNQFQALTRNGKTIYSGLLEYANYSFLKDDAKKQILLDRKWIEGTVYGLPYIETELALRLLKSNDINARQRLFAYYKKLTTKIMSKENYEDLLSLSIWQYLLAADESVPLKSIPLLQRHHKDENLDNQSFYDRKKFADLGHRLLQNVLQGKRNDYSPFMPNGHFPKHPKAHPLTLRADFNFGANKFLDQDFGVIRSENAQKNYAGNIFLFIFNHLKTAALQNTDHELIDIFNTFSLSNMLQPGVSYPIRWGEHVETPSLAEYVLMAAICGPEKVTAEDNLGWGAIFQLPRLTKESPVHFCNRNAAKLPKGSSKRPHQLIFKNSQGKDFYGAISFLKGNLLEKYKKNTKLFLKEWDNNIVPLIRLKEIEFSHRYRNITQEYLINKFITPNPAMNSSDDIDEYFYERNTNYSLKANPQTGIHDGIRELMALEINVFATYLKGIFKDRDFEKGPHENHDVEGLTEKHDEVVDMVVSELRFTMNHIFNEGSKTIVSDEIKKRDFFRNFLFLVSAHHPKFYSEAQRNLEILVGGVLKTKSLKSAYNILNEYESPKNMSYKGRTITFILERILDLYKELETYENQKTLSKLMQPKEH